jgi:hypothetical protein
MNQGEIILDKLDREEKIWHEINKHLSVISKTPNELFELKLFKRGSKAEFIVKHFGITTLNVSATLFEIDDIYRSEKSIEDVALNISFRLNNYFINHVNKLISEIPFTYNNSEIKKKGIVAIEGDPAFHLDKEANKYQLYFRMGIGVVTE